MMGENLSYADPRFSICLPELHHHQGMTQYIRNQNPGNTYFFTVCLADLHSDFLVTQMQLLRDAVKLCQKQRPFTINAAVILPATAHMIWTLPAQDADYSARWRQIKSTFSRHVLMPDRRGASQITSGQRIRSKEFRTRTRFLCAN